MVEEEADYFKHFTCFGNITYYWEEKKKELPLEELLTLVLDTPRLEKLFVDAMVILYYKDVTLTFEAEEGYTLENIEVGNTYEVLYEGVNLFLLSYKDMIDFFKSEYLFVCAFDAWEDIDIDNLEEFEELKSFIVEEKTYFLSLFFEKLGLSAIYDDSFEKVEVISVGRYDPDDE